MIPRCWSESNGLKVVTAYFVLAHVVPILGNALFARTIVSIYKISPLSLAAVVTLAATYGLFAILHGLMRRRLHCHPVPRLGPVLRLLGWIYLRSRVIFLAGATAFSGYGLATGINHYRYASTGLAETGSAAVIVAVILNSLLLADAFYVIFVRNRQIPDNDKRRLEDFFLAAALLLGANGTATVLQALVVLAFAVSPGWFSSQLFSVRRNFTRTNPMKLVPLLLLILVLLASAWMAGEILKAKQPGESFGATAGRVEREIVAGREFGGGLPSFLVERFSIYHYSFLYTLPHAGNALASRDAPLTLPWHTFLFRLDHLLGNPYAITRPAIGSLMQLNYRLLAKNPINRREGSSPGILAVFNYLLPEPLNIIGCAVYLLMIARLIDLSVGDRARRPLSFLGAFCALVFLALFFQSPLDFLSIFDNATIYAALLLAICLARKSSGIASETDVISVAP